MKNRFALLDVFDGYKERTMSQYDDVIIKFRQGIGDEFLQWGAAYYPWLHSTVVSDNEINFKKNISNLDGLEQLLYEEMDKLDIDEQKVDLIKAEIARISSNEIDIEALHQTLLAVSVLYKKIRMKLKRG